MISKTLRRLGTFFAQQKKELEDHEHNQLVRTALRLVLFKGAQKRVVKRRAHRKSPQYLARVRQKASRAEQRRKGIYRRPQA